MSIPHSFRIISQQQLLCLPLRIPGFRADRDVAVFPDLLSILVLSVDQVLAIGYYVGMASKRSDKVQEIMDDFEDEKKNGSLLN